MCMPSNRDVSLSSQGRVLIAIGTCPFFSTYMNDVLSLLLTHADKTLATVTLMQVAVANMSFIPKEEGALYFTRPR